MGAGEPGKQEEKEVTGLAVKSYGQGLDTKGREKRKVVRQGKALQTQPQGKAVTGAGVRTT